MTYSVGVAFSVGDTIPRFTISIEQDNMYMHLHIKKCKCNMSGLALSM